MSFDVSRLTAKFHDAGFEVNAWPEAMRALTDALGIAGAACIVFNRNSRHADWVCFSGVSAAFESKYVDHYAKSDPFSPLLRVTTGWTNLSDCLPRPLLARSEWYGDFVLGCGVADMTGSCLVDTPSHYAIFGLHQKIGRHFGVDSQPLLAGITDVLQAATSKHVHRMFGSAPSDIAPQGSTAGTRYYFHVENGRVYPDRTGTVFSSRDGALAHAWRIAAELAQDKGWNGFNILLTDADGNIIAQLPIPQ
jgi:hypothetical protein